MEAELDKLSAILVSAMAVVGVIGGLFLNATIAIVTGPILGVVAGFILSYFVQTRTQRRAWKRDYVIKSIDSIYGPLHDESIKMEETYNDAKDKKVYLQFIYTTWSSIKNNYKYHLIDDENFRKEIGEFYALVEECNNLVRSANEKTLEVLRTMGSKMYNVDIVTINYYFKVPNGMRDCPDSGGCLLRGLHPKDAFKRSSEVWGIAVVYKLDDSNHASKDLTTEKDFQEFDKFWDALLKKINDDQQIQKMKSTYDKVQSENLKLREKLVERIQLQWKV